MLDDPVVLVRGLDQLSAFVNTVRSRLLDVDIFASLAGPDRRQCVPVIRQRYPRSWLRWVSACAWAILLVRSRALADEPAEPPADSEETSAQDDLGFGPEPSAARGDDVGFGASEFGSSAA